MIGIGFLIALYAGFTHAFDVDHIIAIGNIINTKTSKKIILKDGLYWGLGHTSTILLVGIIVIIFKVQLHDKQLKYLESIVGLMLIIIGSIRLFKWKNKKIVTQHFHHDNFNHSHDIKNKSAYFSFLPAYAVGLIHGMAGSGSLILVVITKLKSTISELTYLLIFGIGSIFGMMLVVSLLSSALTKKILDAQKTQNIILIISSTICIIFGIGIIYSNFN